MDKVTIYNAPTGQHNIVDISQGETLEALLQKLHISKDFYVTCNGRILDRSAMVEGGAVYRVILRLPGGKGGFGSMLRAIGAQIEKTTNHEACRDLSGRRMRDVNYEKEMKDWIGKKADREREKIAEREARKARRRAKPNHKFDDPKYREQTATVSDNLTSALSAGMEASKSKKRKVTATVTSSSQKACEWLGVDDADLSSDDSDSNSKSSSSNSDLPGTSKTLLKNTTDSVNAEGGLDCSETSGSQQMNDDHNGSAITDNVNDAPTDHENVQISDEKFDEKMEIESRSNDVIIDDKVMTTEQSSNKDAKQDNMDSQKQSDSNLSKVKTSHDLNQEKQINDANFETDIKSATEVKSGDGLLEKLRNIPPEANQQAVEKIHEDTKDFDLDNITNIEELHTFGLDVLKQELVNRGMKCGGTLEERAGRLWCVKGVGVDDIDVSLLAKGKGGGKKSKKSK